MKVLIMHASAGAGHKRAAEAMSKAFALEKRDAEVKVCDILDFTPAIFRKTYGKGYLDVVRKAPELWGYMYSQSDKQSQLPVQKVVRSIFNELNTHSFRRFFEDFAPDAVVCTHFMPLELLSTRAKRKHLDLPIYCIVTDFAVHSLWLAEGVAEYFVATEEARRYLLRKNQPKERIKLTGIPIDPVFSTSETPEEARKKLGLDRNMKTVLLLSGGFGVGPTADLIASMSEMEMPCQFLVVAGANEKMKKEAEAAAEKLKMPVKVFGFVNNIHELMDASDIVISKPGGLTTSEVLAKGKPMIVIDPIPGQEQRNCEYLLEAGVAARLHEVEDAPYKLQKLFSDPSRLELMKKNALKIGRPFAARDIAREIMSGK